MGGIDNQFVSEKKSVPKIPNLILQTWKSWLNRRAKPRSIEMCKRPITRRKFLPGVWREYVVAGCRR